MDRLTDPPGDDEFELSVFGAGVGEALVLHLGEGRWGVVDSLRETGGQAVALRYLDEIGIPRDSISFVLATHWHDDHIDGLADVLEASPTAMFGCSAAYTGREFAAVTLEYPDALKSSGVREIRRCFQLVEAAGGQGGRANPKRILEHQNVWWDPHENVVVHALAPTSGALTRAEQDIVATLLPLAQKRRAVGRIKPNQASIVLTVRDSADSALLGGDLEERGSAGTGWSTVVSRFPSKHPRSSAFKVPHHGSDGAHFEGQWTTLLTRDPGPIAVVTAFTSSALPRDGDLRRLTELASCVYLCGGRGSDTALTRAERRRLVADGIRLDPDAEVGHVRLRRTLGATGWTVTLAGRAAKVDPQQLGGPPQPTRRRRRRRRR